MNADTSSRAYVYLQSNLHGGPQVDVTFLDGKRLTGMVTAMIHSTGFVMERLNVRRGESGTEEVHFARVNELRVRLPGCEEHVF